MRRRAMIQMHRAGTRRVERAVLAQIFEVRRPYQGFSLATRLPSDFSSRYNHGYDSNDHSGDVMTLLAETRSR